MPASTGNVAGLRAQKLFGCFGGHGLEGTAGFMESLGLRPGRRNAFLAGLSETLGGALLTLGALTPVATTALNATMVTAIRKVHWDKGPFVASGGWEYNAAVVASLTALTEQGPGKPSVDAAAFPRLRGTSMALLSLGAGIAGSYLATSPMFTEPEPAVQGGDGVYTPTDTDARDLLSDAQLAPETTSA